MPANLNARNEIEFTEDDEYGQPRIRYEKPRIEDMDVLIQIGLCKTELTNMQKQKKASGTVVFDLSAQAKSKNGHDDHADVIMMLCDRLAELRANEVLDREDTQEDLSKIFNNNKNINTKKRHSPFGD